MMQTICKGRAGGQREGEVEEDRRGEHRERKEALVLFPVSHYLGHLLDATGDVGMKGTTEV